MLKIIFFARIREQLDCPAMDLEWRESYESLADVEATLVEQGGERWATTLAEENLVRAINHKVTDVGSNVSDGDEIAYYPPVTGG